jgi:rhomboid protease GluP
MDPSVPPTPAAAMAMADAGPASPGELRYRAVLRALIAPSQGALLVALRPDAARLLLGQGQIIVVVLDHSGSEEELSAQLESLTAEHGPKQRLRLVLVSDRAWARPVLKKLKERSARGLALYHVTSAGEVFSQTPVMLSELRPALRAQATARLAASEPRADFLAELQAALQMSAAQIGDAQSFLGSLQARPVRVTYALLALYAVMFALSYAFGGPERLGVLSRLGAEVPERIRQGEWWRLLSATVLHASVMHILMNSLVLWSLGTFMERLLGWGRFLTLYVLSGLLGSVLGTILAPLLKFGLSVGASGALFGLLGASAVLAFRPPAGLPALLVNNLKKNATTNLILNVFVSLLPNIDWAAHLGGALVGGLLVLVGIVRLTPLSSRERGAPVQGAARSDRWFATVGALLGLALVGCAVLAVVKGRPWALGDLSAAARIPIGKTGLSIEAPRVLGSPQPAARPDGLTELSLGGEESGQWVSLIISPLDPALPTVEQRQTAWEASLAELKRFRPDADATAAGEPAALMVGGFPTLDARFTLKGGVGYRRLTQLRSRHLVILELVTPPKTSEAQRVDIKRMVESVREEPARAP